MSKSNETAEEKEPKTMGEMFPPSYLNADAVKAQPEAFKGLIVTEFQIEEISEGKNKKVVRKPVLYFHGIKQGLVLNKTNRARFMEKYGFDDSTPIKKMIGKEVTLTTERADAFGKLVDAVRIV